MSRRRLREAPQSPLRTITFQVTEAEYQILTQTMMPMIRYTDPAHAAREGLGHLAKHLDVPVPWWVFGPVALGRRRRDPRDEHDAD
jgi:hypothetical protein